MRLFWGDLIICHHNGMTLRVVHMLQLRPEGDRLNANLVIFGDRATEFVKGFHLLVSLWIHRSNLLWVNFPNSTNPWIFFRLIIQLGD